MTDTPFTSIACINGKTTPKGLDKYTPFLTNRFYSYFKETILIANLGNQLQVDNDLHFGFYNSTVSKGKRFSKWAKSTASGEVNVIAEYYDISPLKAKDVMLILTEEQKGEIITYIRSKANVG